MFELINGSTSLSGELFEPDPNQESTADTVAAELESGGLFHLAGSHETAAIPFRQPVHEWIESYHARNGFSRDRMGPAAAATCDERLRQMIGSYCPDDIVEQQIFARILWGSIH